MPGCRIEAIAKQRFVATAVKCAQAKWIAATALPLACRKNFIENCGKAAPGIFQKDSFASGKFASAQGVPVVDEAAFWTPLKATGRMPGERRPAAYKAEKTKIGSAVKEPASQENKLTACDCLRLCGRRLHAQTTGRQAEPFSRAIFALTGFAGGALGRGASSG